MKFELMRFRVLAGKETRVQEWMEFLNANMPAVEETLEPEQMYVESIFAEQIDGVYYLYWYSVQGDNPQSVHDSEYWLDHKHLEFWRECIDPNYPGVKLTPKVLMLPQRVLESMKPLP
ncbi:DUF6176 family protein [Rothia terrae]